MKEILLQTPLKGDPKQRGRIQNKEEGSKGNLGFL